MKKNKFILTHSNGEYLACMIHQEQKKTSLITNARKSLMNSIRNKVLKIYIYKAGSEEQINY